jgi:ankyrin repeat protein
VRILLVILVTALLATPARADVDLSIKRPSLITATMANDAERVRTSLLQKKENPNIADADGRTALMHAAMNGNVEIVQLLLDYGAKVNATDSAGSTALHWAAERGQPDTARTLIAARAAVDADNKQGATPLMKAAATGSAPTVDLLLAAGADPKRQDYTGRSALDYARDKRLTAIVQRLQAPPKR